MECLEHSKHDSGTSKLSSILTNGHNSRASSKNRRSKPKHLDEQFQNHTDEDGLFVNKDMFHPRDKEYEELCKNKRNDSRSRRNKKVNASAKIEEDGHGKVCCGGSACCNER